MDEVKAVEAIDDEKLIKELFGDIPAMVKDALEYGKTRAIIMEYNDLPDPPERIGMPVPGQPSHTNDRTITTIFENLLEDIDIEDVE